MENTIKITVTETTEREVVKEITLPYYSSPYTNTFNMVVSETEMVNVFVLENDACIAGRTLKSSINEAIQAPPCTEQAFNTAFTKALEIISKNVMLLVSIDQLPEPPDFEKEKEERGDYSVAPTLTVEK